MPNDITLTLAATSRQILVSYTVPAGEEATVCTVEISESASYSPVINDVNTTLFSGSASDNRTGSLGAGTLNRVFLAGTIPQPAGTISNLAGDSRRYGRALQPNTTHYVRVTCGTHTGTGSVSTKNIPLGMTRAQEMPVASAGTYAFPSMNNSSRTEVIVDPTTGIPLRKFSIPTEDSGASGISIYGTGAVWTWAQSTITDSSGTPGYLVTMPTGGGSVRLYFVTQTESRYLGSPFLHSGAGNTTGMDSRFCGAPGGNVFGTDPTKLYFVMPDTATPAQPHIVRCQLPASGSTYYDTSVASGTEASCTYHDLTLAATATLGDLCVTKAAANGETFDKTIFYAGANPVMQGDYLLFHALSGLQDTYGWMGAADVTTDPATVVALAPLWRRGSAGGSAPGFRWCGIHAMHPALGTSKMSFTPKSMYQHFAHSDFITTLSTSMNSSQMTITFTSNTPLGWDGSAYTENLYSIAAGDEINVDHDTGNQEFMYLGSFVSGTTWNIAQRGVAGSSTHTHNAGATVQMQCKAHSPSDYGSVGPSWWNFLADPYATDTTGTNLIVQLGNVTSYAGHEGFANGRGLAETGWAAYIGSPGVNNTVFTIADSPTFAGQAKAAGGNAWQKHCGPPQQSSADVTQSLVWGTDWLAFDADPELNYTSLTNVTGTLFKFVNTNYWANGAAVLASRKKLPMLAIVGSHPLLDISSTATGNVISGLAADNYKYCIANAVNECRTGSAVGDIYINTGTASPTLPPNGKLPYSDATSVCFGHPPAFGSMATQIGIIDATSIGKYNRGLTHGLMGWKLANTSGDVHSTPDGKWVQFLSYDSDTTWSLLLAKVPPWPGYDSIDRNTFTQKAITVSAVGGADNAIIEFGYDPNFYCTSRNEVCVSAASNNPYFFASESYSGVPCTSGCTVNIPVIPDRTVYYRIKWRNGTTPVQTSGTFIVAEDSAPVGGGSGDSTPPTGSITSPTDGQAVSGTITITANASDDVAVAGVQFKYDSGNNIGSEDVAIPYSVSWDTRTVSDGPHTIYAVVRDTSSNTFTTSSITVNVGNNVTVSNVRLFIQVI